MEGTDATRDPRLQVAPAPFLKSPVTTPAVMRDVVIALVPVTAAAVWFFGVESLLVVAAATAGAIAAEWAFTTVRPRHRVLGDWSAALTGILLGLTLPPAFPLWMAFLGGVVAIGLGKSIWGGLGHNLFNPALVGRAFLQAAFPQAITTWVVPRQGQDLWHVSASTLAVPFTHPTVDAVTGATPLGAMKFAHEPTPLAHLLWGNTGGSLGETSALLILVGCAYLIARRAMDWRIPVAVMGAAVALSAVLWATAPDRYPSPAFMALSGGLLFGAVYMATDPVTSPLSPVGVWVFGALIGVLVVLIRLFGGLPEGVMYAILIANAAVPHIDRHLKPRPFGRRRTTS